MKEGNHVDKWLAHGNYSSSLPAEMGPFMGRNSTMLVIVTRKCMMCQMKMNYDGKLEQKVCGKKKIILQTLFETQS